MDIQKLEKESLAAYVHQFKRKPNAAISQMMLPPSGFHKRTKQHAQLSSENLCKGCHYRGRETSAAQLTTTILPSSMVNMMLNKDNQCFQCQEPGHIARHCPHIRCHDCEEYRHIVMDCPNKIPPSGTASQGTQKPPYQAKL